MPNISPKTYSLPEIARILGVDEKQLHRFAHKGLVDPALSNDATVRFTDLDCARLQIIKRADELGYDSDSIFKLIGKPNEVVKVADPLSACQRFAMERYKQLYDELDRCEPLEQLNKQCDLRLITGYIKQLNDLKKGIPQNYQRPKAEPKSKPRPTAESGQAPLKVPKQESSPSPRIGSFSAAKLWEYFDEVDQHQKKETPKSRRIGPGSQKKRPSAAKDGQNIQSVLKKAPQRALSALHSADSRKWFKSEAQEIWKGFGEPKLGAWIIAGIAMTLVAIGYFMLFGGSDKTAQMHVAEKQQAEQQLAESGDQRSQELTAQTPGKPVSPGSSPPEERVDSQADQQTAPPVASLERSLEPVPPLVPKTVPGTAVEVENVSLWHDALENIYRADFTILKSKVENSEEPLTGYAFVYLEFTDDSSKRTDLLLPRGELQSGKPAQVREGYRFSIKNLIQMRLTTVSTLSPKDLTAGKVFVYSPDGDLLLEKPFKAPIQPFFSASKERPAPPEGGSKLSDAPTEAAFAQLESKRMDTLESQQPDTRQQSTVTQTDKQQAPPLVETQVNSGTQTSSAGAAESSTDTKAPVPKEIKQGSGNQVHTPAKAAVVASTQVQPKVSEQDLRSAQKVQPAVKPRRTDDPEAAVWDQKSYNAAVQGDFDQAIAYATKAIRLDPGRINPYINRSWAYIEKNMLDRAIEDCRIALSIDPKNAFAYNNRGLVYQRKAILSRAKNDYRKACDLGLDLGCQNYNSIVNQSRIAALIDQSQRAFAVQDWDGVIRATTEVISLDSQNAVAYTNRSAAYAQKNFLNKALKDSNEAIKYNPEFSLAYNNRAYVLELLGNNKRATADYLKSCSLGLDLGCKNFERLNQTQ